MHQKTNTELTISHRLMMATQGSILLATTLILGACAYTAIAVSVYLRTDGMQLKAADPIETTTNMDPDQCLGVCLHNTECKAFNVYPSSSSSPSRCEFFAVNKCSPGAELNLRAGVSYYDTIGNKQCEMSKLPWSFPHDQAFHK